MIDNQVTLFADLFSATILLLLLISIVTSKQYRYGSTKTLIFCMAISIVAILSDALSYYCEGQANMDRVHLISLGFTLLLINIIEALVGIYINCYINEHKKPGTNFTYRFSIITSIVEACCFLLTLILLLTGTVFIVTDGIETTGSYYLVPFALDATASIFMVGYIYTHRQYISHRDTFTIFSVVAFTAAGYLLDGLLPKYNFSVMFGIIAILLNYLLVKEREILDLKNAEETNFRKQVQAVLSLSENFEVIFLVNLDNGSYKVTETSSTEKTFIPSDFSGPEHFIEKNKVFIANRIHPDDRQNVLNAINIDFLAAKFIESSEYTVNYRIMREKKAIWYKMRIRPEKSWPARHKVLIGIFNNDEEHRKEKAHEIELEKQLSRYTLVHNIIGSGSWSFFFDSNKEVYDRVYSDELIRMFGYTPPIHMKFSWENIMHPDDLEQTKQALEETIHDQSGQTPFEIEHRMKKRDGTYHWYHSSGRVLLNEDGSGELLGTHINIDAVHEKKELEIFRDKNYIFMQFRDDVFNYLATEDTDSETFFDYFAEKLMKNSEADQIFYKRADGYTIKKSRPNVSIPGNDVCEKCRLMAYISKHSQQTGGYCIEDPKSCSEEMRIPDECPIKSMQGHIIYNEGVPKGYLAVHFMKRKHKFVEEERNAMTETANLLNMGFERIKARENQKLDLERYHLVHEIVHSGMWSYRFNKNNEIFKAEYSDDLLSIIGWDREHMPDNIQTFQQAIHPDDYEYSTKAFNATLQDKTCQTIFDSEYRMCNQQGEYHWFHSAGRVIRYPNGFGEFFGTHINIDAEKKREELQNELEIARDNAESASAAKTAFLFNMSHDIRTPLNAIIGFTEMALNHKSEENKVGDYLTKVKSSSDFLLSIIDDVLDMSRIESGKTQIEKKVCCITDEAESVFELNSLTANNKNITFIPRIENCSHPYVIADAAHIKQIVVNILNNSMKYTPQGGTIWYTVRQLPAEKTDEIVVQSIVKDTGIGMDQMFLTHIYEPFERAQTTTQSGIQGTGLGMSIVKRLTDLLGGTIDIKSEKNKGTETTVTFVHKIATQEQIEEYEAIRKKREEAEMHIDEAKLIGKRLLLVEDNALNREISEQILIERGLLIETANDGLDAVDRIKEKGASYYDFVLMDIQMPVMNGYAATREIRKLPDADKLFIAAFSANAFEEDKKLCLEAGMNIHVAKPIKIHELTRALASLL